MEIEKFKKWIDVAQQFQTDHFWNKVSQENKHTTLPFPIFKNQIRTEIHKGVLDIFMPFHHNDAERIPISFN